MPEPSKAIILCKGKQNEASCIPSMQMQIKPLINQSFPLQYLHCLFYYGFLKSLVIIIFSKTLLYYALIKCEYCIVAIHNHPST